MLRLLGVGEAAIISSQKVQPQRQLRLMKQLAPTVRWRTKWVLFTNAWRRAHLVAGYSLPGLGLQTEPQVPEDMIPAWVEERARWGNLDHRWAVLAGPHLEKQQSIPLRRVVPGPTMQGAARLTQKNLYVLLSNISPHETIFKSV
jgi:hypothetical protein